MAVRVDCYGGVREAVGDDTLTLALPANTTVGEVVATITAGTPLDPEGVIVVRDGRHLDRSVRLEADTHIALTDRPVPE